MAAETFDTVFKEFSKNGESIVVIGESASAPNVDNKHHPEMGIYSIAAALYLMAEAPKCELQLKTICGQASLSATETIRDIFEIPISAKEELFLCTLAMGVAEGVELKTATLLITHGRKAVAFSVISENSESFRARHLGQIMYHDGKATSYKKSDVEGDDVWTNYLAGLEIFNTVTSWEKSKSCGECHLNQTTSADFV